MPADLSLAVATVDKPAELNVISDGTLLQKVQSSNQFDPSVTKPLSVIPAFHGALLVRPIEALHLLALSSSPRYRDEVFDLYLQWGILRYLGFFETLPSLSSHPTLGVSEAGKGVVGNQRRVASEDLGVGFGALLGTRWLQNSFGSQCPISVIDIDIALTDRFIFAAGERKAVRKIASRRPDYLLVAHDPNILNRYRVRTLECKGTKSKAHAINQLASGAAQLSGVSVAGRVPPGLVVSTVASEAGLCCYVLDPDDSSDAGSENDSALEVTPQDLDEANFFEIEDSDWADRSAALAAAAVRASWATLADFSGNFNAAQNLAPRVMRAKLPYRGRQRQAFDTPFGVSRGYTVTVETAGRRARIQYMVNAAIDAGLSNGSFGEIEEAQVEFAQQQTSGLSIEPASDITYSATPDGSVFSIAVD